MVGCFHSFPFGSLSDVVYYMTMTLHEKLLSIIQSCLLISQRHQGNPKTSQRGSTCLQTWTLSPTLMPSANLTPSMNFTPHSFTRPSQLMSAETSTLVSEYGNMKLLRWQNKSDLELKRVNMKFFKSAFLLFFPIKKIFFFRGKYLLIIGDSITDLVLLQQVASIHYVSH